MNNPQHVKINEVMKNLNPKIYKSRNQFLVEAAIFYIEHYGEDAFMEHEEGIEKEYLSREDLVSLKAELIETAMKEARQEVIRVLGGVISGMQVTQPVNVAAASQPEEPYEEPVDDEVVAGCALNWMMNGEGDASE
jgi:hypothetical protein